MRDKIPAYGGEDAVDAIFTGKRVDKDTYMDRDGFRIHADINGSLNIMRKKYPSLCENIRRENVTDCITVGYMDFYPTVA